MDWWQLTLVLFLIAATSVIIGLFIGILLSDLMRRRRKQPFVEKYQLFPGVTVELESATPGSPDEFPEEPEATELQVEEQVREGTIGGENKETEIIVEQAQPAVLDMLLAELEKNHELSIEPRPDKLLPFQIHTWEMSQDGLHMLSASLLGELAQVYLDMSLANNIIWFLNEFDRKSPNLDDQYVKMCTQINTRLDSIMPLLKQPSS